MQVSMRRKDRQMPKDDAIRLLEQGEYGFLSTISADNTPYAAPVNYVYYGGAIYIHCATVGHKLDNIAHNNAVCFSVVTDAKVLCEKLTTAYKSVVAFGTAQVLPGDETYEPLMAITRKYCADFIADGKASAEKYHGNVAIIKVTIAHMTGKENY